MLAKLDRRTKEAQLLEAARASLTRHVGGAPNDIQRVLIERASRLMVYIETMDAQALADGTMSERNSRQYLAWTNSLRLTLRELGLKAAPVEKLPDLHDILAEHGKAPPWARGTSASSTRCVIGGCSPHGREKSRRRSQLASAMRMSGRAASGPNRASRPSRR
jgi:hypothetical protein